MSYNRTGVNTSEHRLINHAGVGSSIQVVLDDDIMMRWTSSSVSIEKFSNLVSEWSESTLEICFVINLISSRVYSLGDFDLEI